MPESILEEAQRIIHGARSAAYGHPRDNFQNIADVWNGYLQGRRDRPIDTMDVANLMILMKVARLNGTGYHRDSVTDIAGYAGTIERLQEPVEEPLTVECIRWLPGEPRLWHSLAEVPRDVAVRSAKGCRWRHFPETDPERALRDGLGGWLWSPEHARDNGYDYDRTAPFTEVL